MLYVLFLWISVFMFCDLDFSWISIFLDKFRHRDNWRHNLISSDIQEADILMNSYTFNWCVTGTMSPKMTSDCRESAVAPNLWAWSLYCQGILWAAHRLLVVAELPEEKLGVQNPAPLGDRLEFSHQLAPEVISVHQLELLWKISGERKLVLYASALNFIGGIMAGTGIFTKTSAISPSGKACWELFCFHLLIVNLKNLHVRKLSPSIYSHFAVPEGCPTFGHGHS